MEIEEYKKRLKKIEILKSKIGMMIELLAQGAEDKDTIKANVNWYLDDISDYILQ